MPRPRRRPFWFDAHRDCHCRLDEPRRGEARYFDEHDRKLLADVERVGWHVLLVPDDAVRQGWVYSVGMWHSLGSPDLVVCGLEAVGAAELINAVGRRVRSGARLGPSVVFDDLLPGAPRVAFRRVHDSWYRPMFGYGLWFVRGRSPLPVAQVVLADRDGRFPWDEGADVAAGSAQPSLWVPAPQQ